MSISTLFLLTPSGLVRRMQSVFFRATGQRLPYGFGIHGNRTTAASLMVARNPNLISVSKFLQHKSLRTTRQYVRADVINLRKKFNQSMYNRSMLNSKYGFDNNLTNIIQVLKSDNDDDSVVNDNEDDDTDSV